MAGATGAFDREFIYVGTNTLPGRVLKVSKQTLHVVANLTLPVGHDTVVAMQSDGAYVYAATYSTPGWVAQIRKSDMALVAELTLTSGDDKLTAMVHGEDHLYVTSDTNNGRVVRLAGFQNWAPYDVMPAEVLVR